MNTVKKTPEPKKYRWTGKLKDLIGTAFKVSKSAFIGDCGSEDNRLFLITYQGMVLARDPGYTWSYGNCEVKVIRFVDILITVVERKEE